MKLTTIVYLHDAFHLAKDLGVAYRVWEGVIEKPFQKTPKIDFLASFPRIFKNTSKTVKYMMLCNALHHWWKFRTNRTRFGVVIYQKPPKNSRKSYILLIRESLKICNLITTNAIPIKLAMIMYLHDTFHFSKILGVTHWAKEGVVQKLLKTNHKMRFLS